MGIFLITKSLIVYSTCLSFSWHLADRLKLDGAWRQSNKHNNFPIFCSPSSLSPLSPVFLILYLQRTISLLNGIMIKEFVAAYCVS